MITKQLSTSVRSRLTGTPGTCVRYSPVKLSMLPAWIVSILVFCSLSMPLQGQELGMRMDFLNISPSASQLGISEAQTAKPSGAASLYSNPALLAFERSSSLDASYTLWVSNVHNQFAAVNLAGERISYAFGVYNSRSDQFTITDQTASAAGSHTIHYLSLAGAAAYQKGVLSAGISAQYLREDLFEHQANGYSLSVGTAATLLNDRIRLGGALLNLGRMVDRNKESTPLPSSLRIGTDMRLITFSTPGTDDLPLLLSVHADYKWMLEEGRRSDFILQQDDTSFFSLGATAEIAELFELRSGFKFGSTERPFSAGAGFIVTPVQVNYTIIPFSTGYGTVHSIGLKYLF